MVDFLGDIPREYKTHLPRETVTKQEIFGAVGEKAEEAMVEPFVKVGEGIKDSLKRVYKATAQMARGEVMTDRKSIKEAPFEFLGILAGYVAALPIRGVRDLLKANKTLQQRGAQMLLGGPRGETGEWTPEQMEITKMATGITLEAMIGGGFGAGKPGLTTLSVGLRSTGKGAKRVVGAYETLAQEFKVMRKKGAPLEEMKRAYPVVTKGIKQIPKEILDVTKSIGLAPTKRTDIAGRFQVKKGRVEYQITEHLPPETIPHETFHPVQVAKMKAKGVKKINPAVLEAHTYEFEPLFMREITKLPKGSRMSKQVYDQLYDEAFQNMLKKYGTDFSKYKMSQVVSRGHLERKWRKKGELQSPTPPKMGEMIELPGGKARYDGTWEAFGSHPERYQYTFHEGVAKGDTFVSSTQKMADIAAAGMRKIKMRGGK